MRATTSSRLVSLRHSSTLKRRFSIQPPCLSGNTMIVPDADMNLAAFQHRYLIHSESFRQLHAYVGEAFGVSRQESRQDALDRVRRCGHLEHPGVFTFEQLYAIA